jgi:signal transduction histidine kinase
VLAIGFAVYFVAVRVVQDAEDELSRGLVEAGKLVEQHRTTLADTFRAEAELIADLPRLKAAVETGDAPTVAPIVRDYQARIGSDLFVVTDRNGYVLFAVGLQPGQPTIVNLPGVTRALAGAKSSNFWPQPTGVLQVVTVPIAIGVRSPEILGTLSIGFLFDHKLAAQFKSLTDSEVAFAIDGEIRAATVQASDQRALAGLLGSKGVSRVRLNGDDYVALVEPFLPIAAAADAGNPTGASAVSASESEAVGPEVPAAIILQSRTERLRFLNELFVGLAGTALFAILLAVGLSYAVARTVTRPLGVITAAMRDVAATGDLTRKLDLPRGGGWHDEDTSLLARTFNTLTDSIARFQRDAAQRERLSSLGRLSTVIAHEIRNPLMIIKASLRTLRRESITAAETREAAADIDEEVARLNRVVNDVLDFSRPIRFEFATADLNGLCAECAAATTTDGHGPAVRVIGDPSVSSVVTDADRLRNVLVNLLINARDAVLARAGGHGEVPHATGSAPSARSARTTGSPLDRLGVTFPDIELRIARGAAGQIVIIVADQGRGIAAEDLPRVFDPYFTTKRTGTGLGLAIAKNIVEGMGGTIVVESRVGEGTQMRIELPERWVS